MVRQELQAASISLQVATSLYTHRCPFYSEEWSAPMQESSSACPPATHYLLHPSSWQHKAPFTAGVWLMPVAPEQSACRARLWVSRHFSLCSD